MASPVGLVASTQTVPIISRMFVRDDGQALAEVLADVEQDLTGKTRERLLEGLHAAFD